MELKLQDLAEEITVKDKRYYECEKRWYIYMNKIIANKIHYTFNTLSGNAPYTLLFHSV
jgi:hypothetical protein